MAVAVEGRVGDACKDWDQCPSISVAGFMLCLGIARAARFQRSLMRTLHEYPPTTSHVRCAHLRPVSDSCYQSDLSRLRNCIPRRASRNVVGAHRTEAPLVSFLGIHRLAAEVAIGRRGPNGEHRLHSSRVGTFL